MPADGSTARLIQITGIDLRPSSFRKCAVGNPITTSPSQRQRCKILDRITYCARTPSRQQFSGKLRCRSLESGAFISCARVTAEDRSEKARILDVDLLIRRCDAVIDGWSDGCFAARLQVGLRIAKRDGRRCVSS